MEVNVHQAKTELSKLIAAVENGEDVVIARAGKPVVRLVLASPALTTSRKGLRGSGVGKLWIADDAFTPRTDLEVQSLFEAEDDTLNAQ